MNYSISIILPILNEINSLKKTLLIINKIKVDKEFIVIYSEKLTKNSVKDEINSLKKKYKNFRCFKQIKPFVGGAIDLGIIKATKQHIALMASDMETNPYELKNMINVSSKNNKSIVSADRWISNKGFSDYGVIKFLANFTFQKLLKIFFNYNILDFTFAYRVYPKNALKNHRIKELRHGFALETLLAPMKKGFKVITLPAKWKKRVEGNSSMTTDGYISYLRVFFRYI